MVRQEQNVCRINKAAHRGAPLHDTKDELRFIAALFNKYEGSQREHVLRLYLQTVRQRIDWGDIDSGLVIRFAEECVQRAWKNEDCGNVVEWLRHAVMKTPGGVPICEFECHRFRQHETLAQLDRATAF